MSKIINYKVKCSVSYIISFTLQQNKLLMVKRLTPQLTAQTHFLLVIILFRILTYLVRTTEDGIHTVSHYFIKTKPKGTVGSETQIDSKGMCEVQRFSLTHTRTLCPTTVWGSVCLYSRKDAIRRTNCKSNIVQH